MAFGNKMLAHLEYYEDYLFSKVMVTPFLGAIPSACVMVARSAQIVTTLVALLLELVTLPCSGSTENLKEGVTDLGIGLRSFFGALFFAVPLVGIAWLNKPEKLNKQPGFNPFWLFNALGKTLGGVVFLIVSIVALIFATLFCNRCTKYRAVGHIFGLSITLIFCGLAETVPGIDLERYSPL